MRSARGTGTAHASTYRCPKYGDRGTHTRSKVRAKFRAGIRVSLGQLEPHI